jgi:hypothetical protein
LHHLQIGPGDEHRPGARDDHRPDVASRAQDVAELCAQLVEQVEVQGVGRGPRDCQDRDAVLVTGTPRDE